MIHELRHLLYTSDRSSLRRTSKGVVSAFTLTLLFTRYALSLVFTCVPQVLGLSVISFVSLCII